jgi:hypothetical protein
MRVVHLQHRNHHQKGQGSELQRLLTEKHFEPSQPLPCPVWAQSNHTLKMPPKLLGDFQQNTSLPNTFPPVCILSSKLYQQTQECRTDQDECTDILILDRRADAQGDGEATRTDVSLTSTGQSWLLDNATLCVVRPIIKKVSGLQVMVTCEMNA